MWIAVPPHVRLALLAFLLSACTFAVDAVAPSTDQPGGQPTPPVGGTPPAPSPGGPPSMPTPPPDAPPDLAEPSPDLSQAPDLAKPHDPGPGGGPGPGPD
jgi:hypothetical protein